MEQCKLHDIIDLLVQLPESQDKQLEILLQLSENVENALTLLAPCEKLNLKVNDTVKVTPKFVYTSLYILKLLSEFSSDDSSSNLISIQQQGKIKNLLQIVFSLGLTPSLVPGVDIPLKNKTFLLNLLNLEDLTLTESYIMMSEVVRSIIQILGSPNLRSLILTHLGDLLAALLQLIHRGEFKKPVTNLNETNKNATGKAEKFIMTEKWYEKLVNDREEFKKIYKELVDSIYKPLVIRQLIILLSQSKDIVSGVRIMPPSWLRRAITQQLTGYLINPGGVSLILRAMCESNADTADWKKVEQIAKLISTVQGNLSDDDFYSVISPQIILMLNSNGPYYVPVAKKCIKNIYEHSTDICSKYIFDKLFEPFIICSNSVSESFSGILISEDCLSKCIDQLEKCFTQESSESSLPISVLTKIIKILYQLYIKIANSPCKHKMVIQNLLVEFLYAEKDIKKLKIIYDALIFQELNPEILKMNEGLAFEFGPTGGVQVVKKSKEETPQRPDHQFELEYEMTGDYMLDLLSSQQQYSKQLVTDLFVILLSSLSNSYHNKTENPNLNPELLNADDIIMFFIRISQKKMITIKLLASLAENVYVIESIQESPEMVFKFIKSLLESKAKDLSKEKEEENSNGDFEYYNNENENSEDKEYTLVLLAVVDLMTINVKHDSDKWNMFKSLLKTIEIIRDNSQDYILKYSSEFLYHRILTHGAISGSEKLQSKNFNSMINGNIGKKDNTNDFKPKIPAAKNIGIVEVNKNRVERKELDEVLEELCSSDIPTRGHAIIQLGKLIRRRDPDTLLKKEYVFSTLKQNLEHEDTYIYLAAVNALENLASVQEAEKILEILCDEYTENKKKCSEVQLKIGEVLMKITRGLGGMVPKYKDLLINTFLFGVKSSDELLKISSLSNLGELLSILGYGTCGIIQEIFVCIESIVRTDKSDNARRAAILAAELLLKGISEDNFMILEPVIRDLYRTLLHTYKTDKDEVTRLHAELSLGEINRIVKSSFSKTLKLEKRIGILDLP